MFKNRRFITVGINTTVGFHLQIYLWNLIDQFDARMTQDYLQVFDLSIVENDKKKLQKIIHSQEEPEYRKEYILEFADPVETKIFVIDDEDHSTMLLAEEY